MPAVSPSTSISSFNRSPAHDSIGDYGPHLQVAMFDAGVTPPKDEVERFAERARAALAAKS
jgi:hypothetical protein